MLERDGLQPIAARNLGQCLRTRGDSEGNFWKRDSRNLNQNGAVGHTEDEVISPVSTLPSVTTQIPEFVNPRWAMKKPMDTLIDPGMAFTMTSRMPNAVRTTNITSGMTPPLMSTINAPGPYPQIPPDYALKLRIKWQRMYRVSGRGLPRLKGLLGWSNVSSSVSRRKLRSSREAQGVIRCSASWFVTARSSMHSRQAIVFPYF